MVSWLHVRFQRGWYQRDSVTDLDSGNRTITRRYCSGRTVSIGFETWTEGGRKPRRAVSLRASFLLRKRAMLLKAEVYSLRSPHPLFEYERLNISDTARRLADTVL